jgi:hypothetical protein
MEIPQKTKNITTYDPTIPLLGIDLKEWKSASIETPAHPCLSQCYWHEPSHAVSLGVHQSMNE